MSANTSARTTIPGESFGATIRRQREELKMSLRALAELIDVSPAFMSLCERDKISAPGEDKIKRIAETLGIDRDELLALAGRISTDLKDIIIARPTDMGRLIRQSEQLSNRHLTLVSQHLPRCVAACKA